MADGGTRPRIVLLDKNPRPRTNTEASRLCPTPDPHFSIMTPQILRLSNLPCIDDVEVNDSEVDGGGGGAIDVPRGKGGVAATPNGDETEEYQPPRQWGEVEVRAIINNRLRACACHLLSCPIQRR